MYNTSFIKKILLALTVVLLYSCDKDFNAIGDDLIGDDHFGLQSEKYDVLAYNQEVTPIQSNALTNNALGIYDNPVFGTTTANFATQLTLAEYSPTIGESPEVESVVLSIPYFYHSVSVDALTGSTTYALDSIFDPSVGKVGKLKLSVYESGMQMRSSYFNNNSQQAQLYYTDENAAFDAVKVGAPLNDTLVDKQNKLFLFDNSEIVTKTKDANGVETTTRTAPEMHLNLNRQLFEDKILKAPTSKLSSADVFQEYFRGLYFKVERADGHPANMAIMNFAAGKITIKYKAKTAVTTDGETKERKTLVLNFTGGTGAVSTANFLEDVKQATYDAAIKSPNATEGDEKLYLKGGQGSLAIISLDNFVSKLDEIRANKWLVNEANLTFHIDAASMAGAKEPKRVYLYDLTNNVPLTDYNDGTTSSISNDPKDVKYIFGGIIALDNNKRGTTYKIRITNHIRNLIKDKTAQNVKLGLVVSESVSIVASNALKLKNTNISEAPRASVMNPLGTILYGSKASANVPEDKRLRLEVYYTKPN
ncbi:DUF4270 domain-containing protein [Flavobacterium reichenbachii]|uniref:DUF4270 domain-containing protein n=1 Tax=Flavobacterium reichenbachii TaxID=362418 RepID=A0A085ZT24_9FLAO|nr:DUF4270 domain-containing protein [Flavobacterium reichenbachii]KFF07588.1 hypothetical protein IW19_19680 [Flavobacterium reichenbachii]OXB14230.1 hypothetical protein B0A68_13485 [Flavobacterium reichenbachii]